MRQITYIVTRRCVTGGNEYQHFRSSHPIGTGAALVLPRFPVTVQGENIRLRWESDPDTPRVPGISRPILREDTGKEYARAFWDGTGKHRLHTPFGNFQIECQEGIYAFGQNDICIAAMGRIQKGSEFDLNWDKKRDTGWEPHFAMITTEDLPIPLALLMLSFPLFQLAP